MPLLPNVVMPLLDIGIITAMPQNTIFALPSSRCLLFTDATTPTIQQSNDPAFGTNVAVTLAAGQAEVAGGFIRCTSGNINVSLKKF